MNADVYFGSSLQLQGQKLGQNVFDRMSESTEVGGRSLMSENVSVFANSKFINIFIKIYQNLKWMDSSNY